MKTFYLILISSCTFFYCWNKLFSKYQNEFPIRYYIGLRGKGKTTLATKTAIKHLKLGHNVYSNFELFGAYRLNPDEFGDYNFPYHSAIFLDEVSLIWSNREFKTFKKSVEEFLRLSRKRKIWIYLYSQSFDVD